MAKLGFEQRFVSPVLDRLRFLFPALALAAGATAQFGDIAVSFSPNPAPPATNVGVTVTNSTAQTISLPSPWWPRGVLLPELDQAAVIRLRFGDGGELAQWRWLRTPRQRP